MRRWQLATILLICVSAAAWQSDEPPPAIQKDGIVNAASEMPPLLGGGAVAPGSVVHIRGWRLGSSYTTAAAGFPLPEELGGISVEIRQGKISKRAVMLSLNIEEIEAILPQDAPLGDVTMVLHRRESVSEPYPVRIVKSSFGIQTEASSEWGVPGIIHNGWPPERSPRNSLVDSARPGQTVSLRGTGLGAGPIAATDEPHRVEISSANLTILVAGKRVRTIRFAGRSECCAGYDDLAFDLPADTPEGCHVPIQVRSAPGIASNFASLAVMRDGGRCVDIGGWSDLLPAGSKRSGLVDLHHADILLTTKTAGSMRYVADLGFAKFVADPPRGLSGNLIMFPPPGTCTASERVSKLKNLLTTLSPLHGIEGVALDGGPALSVDREREHRPLSRVKDALDYVSVLGGDLPIPIPVNFPLFLQPGNYRVTADSPSTGAISYEVPVGKSLEWTNRNSISTIDRAKGVTLRWKPGQRSDLIVITASNVEGDSGSTGAAVCVANAAGGSFSIPPEVLSNIPGSKEGELPLDLVSITEVPGQAPPQLASGQLEYLAGFYSSSSVRTVRFR
jgi:uncharacterized protein (TIGR03437 family)